MKLRCLLTMSWRQILLLPTVLLWYGADSGRADAQGDAARYAPPVTGRSLARRRVSNEPLEPIGKPTARENQDLDAALNKFGERTSRDDFAPLTDFLALHPESAWKASLLSELGDEYYRTGHFSKALAAWEQVWRERQPGSNSAPLALPLQHAAASLAGLYARLGRMEPLRQLLGALEGTPLMGQYAQLLRQAKDGLWTMDHRPEIAFRCGPLALDRIRSWGNPTNACDRRVFNSQSTTNGICLASVAQLAQALGMNYQVAHRTPGAEVIVPAVIHWKVGHYAAVVRQAHGLFLTQDPTFRNDTWASPSTLDEEASGYFLVPAGPLPPGWRPVGDLEARGVWGKGTTGGSDPDATSDRDMMLKDESCHGMAVWNFNLMMVNQRISDNPIGYRPPVGPPVEFTFTMSAQDNWMRQFASWWGTTLGENWSCNWNSFIQDDPLNPSGNLRVYDRGGWLTFIEDPTQPGVFRCQFRNPGYITRLFVNGTDVGYAWNLPDGGRQIYGHNAALTAGSTGNSLMTAVVDPAGNAVTLEYDDNFPGRIMAIVDALGQRTTLEYGLSDPGAPPPNPISQGNSQFNWQVTKITDPFGRSATFQYRLEQDGSPPAYFYYVTNITDVAGLSSQMTFYRGWAMDSFPVMPALTTPYGTTTFRTFVIRNRDFGFEVTEPDGNVQRLQYCEDEFVGVPIHELQQNVPQGLDYAENDWLFARNVYYWDKKALAEGFSLATNDYSKAVIYHFTHAQDLTASGPILESLKRPLENRIWFNYPGQGAGWFPGTDDHPSKVGRVLDDGATQLWQFGYNSYGNLTNSVDPLGRNFRFLYDTNDIDLLEIRQTRNGQNVLLWKATYNSQHLPTAITDMAGQATTYTYNSKGQVLRIVNAKNQTNTFEYNANGYLTALDGPLSGPQDRETFTYDPVGRLRTATDQDGYTITLDYDNMDRLTRTTFPDGTYQEIAYDRLKPGSFRDRLGRLTTFTYTSLGQLASVQDPLGRLTRLQWCRCGELEALIDPLGRMTSWQRDLQGRATAKLYPDGTAVRYDYEQTTSRLRRIRDPQNQITQFDYFPDDALRKKSYLNAIIPTPSVEFTFDPDYPRLATMQDGEGTTTYGYYPIAGSPSTGAGQLASVTGPWANDTITYRYDEVGRIVSRAINGSVELRTFDEAGRLQQLTNVLGTFAFTWEGGSTRLATVQYPNGQHSQYSYYPNLGDQHLQSITHYLPAGAILSQFTYAYDAAGRITNWTQLQAGITSTLVPGYDDADRVTSVALLQGGSTFQTFSYAYDDADNRLMEKIGAARRDFSYNALDEMATVSSSAETGTSYEWDAAHRLVAVNQGTHRSEFSYDGWDRRIRIVEKDSGSVTGRCYLWRELTMCEERDASGGVVLKEYSPFGISSDAAGDLPIGHYFLTRDHLRSIRELTDATGAIQGQFSYDPYGRQTRLGGTLNADFGMNGHFVHQPTRLCLAPFRVYDADLARWLSRDPFPSPSNAYADVLDDPLNFLDLFGAEATTGENVTAGILDFLTAPVIGPTGMEVGAVVRLRNTIAMQIDPVKYSDPKNQWHSSIFEEWRVAHDINDIKKTSGGYMFGYALPGALCSLGAGAIESLAGGGLEAAETAAEDSADVWLEQMTKDVPNNLVKVVKQAPNVKPVIGSGGPPVK